ncbi:MAG: hypothetical protein IT236_05895, partial [Bacteroidia bacterium]|nr:hypothetical protein [Bacteroidia bacterium]
MKKVIFLSFVSSLIVTLSCKKDFVVENIDNKTLTINAPANNLVTPNNVVTFWWEPLSRAEKYNLQVVKPNFANLTQLVVDTNVTTTKFNLSLQPGNYQW